MEARKFARHKWHTWIYGLKNKTECTYLNIIAPEVMCRQNHGVAVDYYALGVIGYECMIGRVK